MAAEHKQRGGPVLYSKLLYWCCVLYLLIGPLIRKVCVLLVYAHGQCIQEHTYSKNAGLNRDIDTVGWRQGKRANDGYFH